MTLALIAPLARNGQIERRLRHVRLDVVGAGAWVFISYIQPTVLNSSRIRAEYSKFDALRLGKSSILPNFSQTLANGRVIRIVNIDVSSRTRIGGLHILIAFSLLLLTERYLYRLFL